ncbi:MAG: deoxyribose-phosphate aldolase [Nitrospirota bacterium]|jgi:deoxyribose-phosphate aldolase
MEPGELAALIEHTLLRPGAGERDVRALCAEAREYGFFAVCVHPVHVSLARGLLGESPVRVATVVGFPLGMNLTPVKVYEAMQAALEGADELDMVMKVGAAREGRWEAVQRDMADVVLATPELTHKVILECALLSDEEKVRAARAAVEAGAEFVKTSTGFGPWGARVEDVGLLREAVGGRAGVKAAGGIKTLADLLSMVRAGAARIGTSSGVAIMKEAARGR